MRCTGREIPFRFDSSYRCGDVLHTPPTMQIHHVSCSNEQICTPSRLVNHVRVHFTRRTMTELTTLVHGCTSARISTPMDWSSSDSSSICTFVNPYFSELLHLRLVQTYRIQHTSHPLRAPRHHQCTWHQLLHHAFEYVELRVRICTNQRSKKNDLARLPFGV